jgi:hypothetical protein
LRSDIEAFELKIKKIDIRIVAKRNLNAVIANGSI